MKRMRLLPVLFFPLVSVAQPGYFITDTVSNGRGKDSLCIFPYVLNEKNATAANRINTYLHADFLHVLPGVSRGVFSDVSPAGQSPEGTTHIRFNVLNNTQRVFTIEISALYTSVYTEPFHIFYSFNSCTGTHLSPSDLITPEGNQKLAEQIWDYRDSVIKYYLAGLDTSHPGYSSLYSMYTHCLDIKKNASLESDYFYVTDSAIVFLRERCSDYALAPVDTLWEMPVSFSIRQIESLLTSYGKELLLGDVRKARTDRLQYPGSKLLTGTLGNTTIYVIPGALYSEYNSVSGMMFETGPGYMMELSGIIHESQWQLRYLAQGIPIAQISGVYHNGKYSATWFNLKTRETVKFMLELAE